MCLAVGVPGRAAWPALHGTVNNPTLDDCMQIRILEREKAAAEKNSASAARNADVFGEFPLIQSAVISGRAWSRYVVCIFDVLSSSPAHKACNSPCVFAFVCVANSCTVALCDGFVCLHVRAHCALDDMQDFCPG